MEALFVGMSHLEVEAHPAWVWDAANKDQFLRLLGPYLKLLAPVLGFTAANFYLYTALFCQVAEQGPCALLIQPYLSKS